MTFECGNCGACCRTFATFMPAADAKWAPRIVAESRWLPARRAAERWTYQLFPLPVHETCCILDPDSHGTIYPTRPAVCRAFAAGSDQCQAARVASD